MALVSMEEIYQLDSNLTPSIGILRQSTKPSCLSFIVSGYRVWYQCYKSRTGSTLTPSVGWSSLLSESTCLSLVLLYIGYFRVLKVFSLILSHFFFFWRKNKKKEGHARRKGQTRESLECWNGKKHSAGLSEYIHSLFMFIFNKGYMCLRVCNIFIYKPIRLQLLVMFFFEC